jgi:hypothetical protein
MQKNKIYGSALIDCVTASYQDPTEKFQFRKNTLFWFLCKNKDIFKIQNRILKDFKQAFRVAWIYPYEIDSGKRTTNFYFLFAVYKNNTYFLNKNPIREKHIWKDVEWGKRKKNYNSKGKDPGTVWIEIVDDGKANTIEHLPYSKKNIIKRLKQSSLKTKKENFLILSNTKF